MSHLGAQGHRHLAVTIGRDGEGEVGQGVGGAAVGQASARWTVPKASMTTAWAAPVEVTGDRGVLVVPAVGPGDGQLDTLVAGGDAPLMGQAANGRGGDAGQAGGPLGGVVGDALQEGDEKVAVVEAELEDLVVDGQQQGAVGG